MGPFSIVGDGGLFQQIKEGIAELVENRHLTHYMRRVISAS